jgi:hypothetical protein
MLELIFRLEVNKLKARVFFGFKLKIYYKSMDAHQKLDLGPSLGSSSKFEPDSRLEVNKLKARARSCLICLSSTKLFSILS